MLEESHMLGHDPTSENELVVFLYKSIGDCVPVRKQLPAGEAGITCPEGEPCMGRMLSVVLL